METRKIQQVSNGTFTVSLPRDWADGEGITTGTVVDIHTHLDGVLVVQPPETEDEAPLDVEVRAESGDGRYLEQTLRAAYAAGSNAVAVECGDGFTAEQRQTVRRVARNLVGVTITEESDRRIAVRTVLDAGEVSIRQSVRQLQFVAVTMHRDAVASLTGDTTVEAMGDRDDRADRLYAMVDRHFTRAVERFDEVDALGETRPELLRFRTAARELERVADHAERIAGVAAAVDEPLSDPLAGEVTEVGRIVREATESAVDVLFEGFDPADARDALETRDRVCSRIDDVERRLFEDGDADYRFAHALYSLRRSAELAGNVAEVGLRTAVRRDELTGVARREDTDDVGEHTSSA